MAVSHDVAGTHFIYVTNWPDSAVCAWIEQDLRRISSKTPAIVCAHDPPDSDSKHFINPNGRHDINDHDKFENLLVDTLNGRKARGRFIIEQQLLPMKGHFSVTNETKLVTECEPAASQQSHRLWDVDNSRAESTPRRRFQTLGIPLIGGIKRSIEKVSPFTRRF